MSPILNYSTSVTASRSITEVHSLLMQNGATSFRTDLDNNRRVSGIEFDMETRFGIRTFRLPANSERVRKVLAKQYQEGVRGIAQRHLTSNHANDVAWRITKDWLKAQLALIAADLADVEEVLLPYMISDDAGHTVYEKLVDNHLSIRTSNPSIAIPAPR